MGLDKIHAQAIDGQFSIGNPLCYERGIDSNKGITNMRKKITAFLTVGLIALSPAGAAHQASVFATGLTGPVKLDLTRQGNLLITEQGTAANDGKLSLVDRSGSVRPILTGLPSGIETTGGNSGPQSPVVDGCCIVHLTIGEGDMLRFSPAGPPGSQVPNATGSVSPIFSSVLRIVFNQPLDRLDGGFALTPADHGALADGKTVKLDNASGESVWIRLVVDFKDARPDPVTNVRGSNPFHMIASAHDDSLLVVDSGQNALLRLARNSWPQVIVRFPPIAQAPGIIPPFSDAVPTAVRHLNGNRYVVSLLTGVPFTPGAASVRVVNANNGQWSDLLTGLTSATDVLVIGNQIYVLQISTNLAAGAPGQLLWFKNRNAEPEIVATGLIGASGMVYDPARNSIFVAELFAGRITRIQR
jgi:hypothetical protein